MIEYLVEDLPEYVSRGQRIRSVLDGSGNVEILPGRPDVPADRSDWSKGEKYDPDIDFDPNSYARMDKFDGVEVGQELIDSELASRPVKTSEAADSNSEEKK
uniref:Uncharacterized protein n=1 Tax=Microviridae sp. ct9AZ11 TaxID=2826728 RepID=A0A8S5NMV1_9VIRU|nr:MAG TPA: hypothetical protein [Microviridae sp. ct9AZ11]